MAADIATLSIKVDSSDVKNADRAMADLSKTGAVVEGMMKKFVAAMAVERVLEFVKATVLLTARYDTLGVAMNSVGKNAGYTAASMSFYQRALQDTGISAIEARNTLTMMASAQIDLAQSSKLARIAQDAAVIGNLNSSEAFERMIQGIRSGQVEILRTIGINVNFEQGYQKLARTLGKTAADLTELEKMQARTNQVMDYGKNIAGTYEAAMGTAGKQIKSMERYADDLQVSLGAVFQPMLKVVVDDFTVALKGSAEAMSNNKTEVDKLGIAYGEMLKKAGGIPGVLSSLGTGTMGPTTLWKTFQAWRAQGRGENPFGTDKVSADWSKVGMSDSEGLEGGDPYGTIAIAKKAAATEAAARAAEKYAKVITPLNQAMGMEKALLEQGERAAYALGLAIQGVTEKDKEALLAKWDYNKALKDQAEQEEFLARLDQQIRKNDRARSGEVWSAGQSSLEAEAAQMERALNVAIPYRQELLTLGQAYEDLTAALDNGTISQQQFQTAETELLQKTQQVLPVMTDMFGDLRDTIQDWSRSSTEAFLDLAFKGKASFTDLINSMLRDLARLAIQKNVTGQLFNYLGMAISGMGGQPTTTASTTGYIDTAPVVAGAMQSGARVEPTINISINSNGPTDTKATGEGAAELGRMVNAVCDQWAVKNMRAGGLLARA